MEMTLVRSSNVESVGYSVDETMRVRFHSGGLYEYVGVPAYLYRQFLNASSKGKFFHEHFSGKFDEMKLA